MTSENGREHAQECIEMMGLMGGMGDGMGAMMAWPMLLSFLLPLLLLLALGAGLLVWLRGQRGSGSAEARRELESRYVRGEIDREAFLQVRRDLEAGGR